MIIVFISLLFLHCPEITKYGNEFYEDIGNPVSSFLRKEDEFLISINWLAFSQVIKRKNALIIIKCIYIGIRIFMAQIVRSEGKYGKDE